MPKTSHPRYRTYAVVHAHLGTVATTHATRSQAEAALNARPDRFAYRVRGDEPLSTGFSPWSALMAWMRR